MKLRILLTLLLLLPTLLFAGPACDWAAVKTSNTTSDNYTFRITDYLCTTDYYKGENIIEQGIEVLDSSNRVIEKQDGYDKVEVVNTPTNFPYQVILTSLYGGSNISHTYHIYSTTPTLKKIGEVDRPVNQWQANKRNGSEKEVVGFYERDGVFLIDRMTIEGTEVGKCNACQKWNVETLKVTDSGLVSLGLREFNINTYHRKY